MSCEKVIYGKMVDLNSATGKWQKNDLFDNKNDKEEEISFRWLEQNNLNCADERSVQNAEFSVVVASGSDCGGARRQFSCG